MTLAGRRLTESELAPQEPGEMKMDTQSYMTVSELTLEDGTVIGTTNMHRGYFGQFQRLGALPHDCYELDGDYQDTHEDTMVYLGAEVAE